jgi:hypothetical protein
MPRVSRFWPLILSSLKSLLETGDVLLASEVTARARGQIPGEAWLSRGARRGLVLRWLT